MGFTKFDRAVARVCTSSVWHKEVEDATFWAVGTSAPQSGFADFDAAFQAAHFAARHSACRFARENPTPVAFAVASRHYGDATHRRW